ncbi:MAG: dihydrodipicolinate synthase family protein [Isosphaeraceae bacterium]
MIQSRQLQGALIPAVPVPFDARGMLDREAQERYARWMAAQPVAGVAVWAHTGRGLHLTEEVRDGVLLKWRSLIAPPRLVVAAAGAPSKLADPGQVMHAARGMAHHARGLGADAVLVHPPSAFRDRPDRDQLILDYHAAVAEAGLPLILFYLYEAAGGLRYTDEVLVTLLTQPHVLGIKIATLDSVMTFQEIANLLTTRAADKVLITGEDRFLGYSLMCGAQAALIGMGAACTALQADLLRSFLAGEADRFLRLNRAVDELARQTFRPPMEGYIQRMLWCLVHQGVLPRDAAHDPWGPRLDAAEFESLGAFLKRLGRATTEGEGSRS